MSNNRVSRKDFIVPRCSNACPAGVDVPRYIRAVRDGRYDDAVAVLRERLPLPTVCADACFAPCEDACAYRQLGDPIAIRALKRAAVDKGADTWKQKKKSPVKSGKKVAVVGAGPAGLSAAYYLASKGHGVTLYDAFEKPGGMMRYGIPKYRLPVERLEKDVSEILACGVEFYGNTVIGKDISLTRLKQDNDAVFVANGATSSARIPLEGSDKQGILWGWEFLRDVAKGKTFELGDTVAVVGGGNVAIDVALTAKRLGAGQVELYCLESREEMPAHPWEITLAEEEGILINNYWGPQQVMGDETASGIIFKKCTSVFNDQGQFDPDYDVDITTKCVADSIILAIGQSPVLDFLEGSQVNTAGNRIQVSEENLATGMDGVFAGGDVVTGPASIVQGIAQGRTAAEAVDLYLGGDGDVSEILCEPEEDVLLDEIELRIRARTEMPHLKYWERSGNFDQVELGYSDEQIYAEASRCLECDARAFEVVLDTDSCKECGYCVEVCEMETFGPAKDFNEKGYRPMEVKRTDWCVGCFTCYFSCPDFAIGVKAKTA